MGGPTAIITGITGQDGCYLRELLLRKGYVVHGLLNPLHQDFVEPAREGVQLHPADLTNLDGLKQLLENIRPTEVYHLAAQSSGLSSFRDPIRTSEINAMGTLRLLEAIRQSEDAVGHRIRFFHASSGELFGANENGPHTEASPIRPRSPYGISKAFAHFSVINYRESYGMHASNGILFNHESPRRGVSFVTRKITIAAARIAHRLENELALGTLDVERDWGYAGDYVVGMWRMLQQDVADDYILATGKTHSVREFVRAAFQVVGLDFSNHVTTDAKFIRPNDVTCLLGDPTKAQTKLGWEPRVGFSELVRLMVEADLQRVATESLKRAG